MSRIQPLSTARLLSGRMLQASPPFHATTSGLKADNSATFPASPIRDIFDAPARLGESTKSTIRAVRGHLRSISCDLNREATGSPPNVSRQLPPPPLPKPIIFDHSTRFDHEAEYKSTLTTNGIQRGPSSRKTFGAQPVLEIFDGPAWTGPSKSYPAGTQSENLPLKKR